jgi:hypothetical protein
MKAATEFHANDTKTAPADLPTLTRRMLSWAPERWISGRKCDVPDCAKESSSQNCLVARAVVGPVVDRPLYLFFCDDHGDYSSLFDRYKSCVTTQ